MIIESIEVIYHEGTYMGLPPHTASIGIKVKVDGEWCGIVKYHKELQTLTSREMQTMLNQCFEDLLNYLKEEKDG